MQIRIVGHANMGQAKAEFAALQAQVNSLNAAMLASTKIPGSVNPKGYENLSRALNEGSKAYRNSLASTGRFHVEQMRINSATENYTELLQKQKLSMRDLIKNQRIMKAAYVEQLRLQQMVVRKTPSGIGDGRHVYDVAVPTMVSKELDTINKRMGWYRAQLASAATQTVNWGKNTQWAGRQLMVGFTMPVAAFGAATGVMAYQVDKEMTRVEKVYDTMANGVTGSVKEVASAERELAQLRKDSFNLAANAANSYGTAIKDTLAIEADLAATGLRGSELMKQTNEVLRIATLGEMDYQTALNASITTQSVYKQSAEETADAFNFMNAVENATSLQLEDFAKALPIAAAPVQQFGGDIKELGILLTAMKQNGVQAVQGANAIKASMQRLLRPSAQVRAEFAQMTGQDITELIAKGDGLVEIFQLLGKATEDLSGKEEGKVFAGLFGSYQVTRMRAMVEGMRDLEKGTGQVSKAAAAAEMTTIELAEAANSELNRWQRSASGRFKRAVELMKVQMAEMGQPFLEAGAAVVEFITKAAKAFNNLPKVMKNGLAAGAIIMAIVGPLVMLTGLFANFAGNIGKFAAFLMGLGTRFNIVNKSQQAAALSAEMAESGMLSEASAAELLRQKIDLLTQSNERAAAATRGLILSQQGASPAEVAMAVGPKSRRNLRATDAPSEAIGYAGGGKRAAVPLADEPMKETSKHMRGAAVSAGVFSAAMAASMISSNQMVDNLANVAMITAGLAPLLSGAFSIFSATNLAKMRTKVGGVITGWTASATKFGKVFSQAPGIAGKFSVATGGAKAMLSSMVSPAALVAASIAAAGYAAYKLYQHTQKAVKEFEKSYNGYEELAEMYGYIASDTEKIMDAEGNMVESSADRVEKFRENFSGLVSDIEGAATRQGKFNRAMVAGINIINSGGTSDQAKLAVRDALVAAEGVADGNAIALRFEAKMDFTNVENVANASIEKALLSTEKAVETQRADFSERFMGNLVNSWKPGFDSSMAAISDEAEAAATTAGNSFATAFSQAAEVKNKGLMTRTLLSLQGRLDNFNKQIEEAEASGDDKRVKSLQFLRDEMLRTFGTKMNVKNVDEMVDAINQGANVTKLLGMYQDSYTRGQRIAFLESKKNLTADEKRRLATMKRIYAEERVVDEVQEGTRELTKQELAALKVAAAAERVAEANKNAADEFKKIDFRGVLKDAHNNAQNDIATAMQEDFDARMQRSLENTRSQWDDKRDADERLAERENERFSNRWERRTEAIEKHFDARTKALENTIEAEKKAEEIRQRIFDAEMKRINRLNEAANRNIDFNVALNSGDLDEAAKIRNDATAAASEWALADGADAGKAKSDRVVERLEARKDKLKDAKDDRLQALKDREEAERKHLTKIQEMRKNSLQKEADDSIKQQEKIWNNRKKNMDNAIRYFMSYIAKNEKQLRAHINRTGNKYEGFGRMMGNKADKWAGVMQESLVTHIEEGTNKIKSDINWNKMGQDVAKDMIRGSLGMNFKQFRRWMISGKWPKKTDKPDEVSGGGASPARFQHSGGRIGYDKGSRTGYARTAPISRNEVPLIAERGEFMVNKNASAKHQDLLQAINNDKLGTNEAPHGGNKYGVGGRGRAGRGGVAMGMAGIMGLILGRMMKSSIEGAVIGQSNRKLKETSGTFTGQAGIYGADGINFSASQMNHAATIASVGSSMGMSKRDIQIGIMTAIAESMLSLPTQAQSDRDSGGLFQQRPSQGWGTVAQVMDPVYASKKFFMELKKVSARGEMSPWMAAQTVQRSAYSDGSNYRKYWDEAQGIFRGLSASGTGMDYKPGAGGWQKPAPPGRGWSNTHDYRVGIGTPLYAVSDGTIVESRAITSGGTAGNGLYPTPYRSYGETVAMRTASGDIFRYAHLNPGTRIAAGRKVKGGTMIGRSGNTGNSSGPHVHMDVNGDYNAMGWLRNKGISLSKGAQNIRFDNTIANLHKGEAVLTEDINKKFRQGVDNFANGGHTEYNVTVNVEGSNASGDEIANKVIGKIRRLESRKPQSRRNP